MEGQPIRLKNILRSGAGRNLQTMLRRYLPAKLKRLLLGFLPYWLSPPIEKFRRDGFDSLLWAQAASRETVSFIVFGGYRGRSAQMFASQMGEQFASCGIYEPISDHVRKLESTFGEDPRLHVFPFGVGAKAGPRLFELNEGSSGSVELLSDNDGRLGVQNLRSSNAPTLAEVDFVTVDHVVENFPGPIGLIEINIEGGEYELVPELHKAGVFGRTDIVLLQFHQVADHDLVDVERIRSMLRQSHVQVFSYEWVWDCWKSLPPRASNRLA